MLSFILALMTTFASYQLDGVTYTYLCSGNTCTLVAETPIPAPPPPSTGRQAGKPGVPSNKAPRRPREE